MKKQYLLPTISFSLLLLLQSCTDQEEAIEPEQSSIEVVLLADNNHLQSLVGKIEEEPSMNGRTASLLSEVNFEKAMKKINSETGTIHYSFSMHSDDGLTIRKFILSENSKNEISGHVFEYEVDASWLAEVGEFLGWDQYNGFFRIIDLEGSIISENEIVGGSSLVNKTNNGRSSGTTCIAYTQKICAYVPSMPELGTTCYYITRTNCFSTNGGSSGNESSQEHREEDVGVEMGPTNMPIDGNGGGGGSGSYLDISEIERLAGNKPIKEYSGKCTGKCTGIQDMWNSYPNNEIAGYLTIDEQVILTNILGPSSGGMNGVYTYQGISYYPSNGQPNNNYQGMIQTRGYYLIPVVASIHTHTPCRQDGTDGASHNVGTDDQTLASTYPSINHWVIGCGAVAQYNSSQSNFFNKSVGNLSSICNKIK